MVALEVGVYLFPSRTQKLSPPSPMLLQLDCGKVGRRQDNGFYYEKLFQKVFHFGAHETQTSKQFLHMVLPLTLDLNLANLPHAVDSNLLGLRFLGVFVRMWKI